MKHAPHPFSEFYKDYRFDEPWDGPHNVRLAGRIGDYYRRQGLDPDGSDQTSFVAVIGMCTAWPGKETRSKKDIRDGVGQTIIAVEMANSGIPWMKPEDLEFDRMSFGVNDGSGRGPGSKISGARALLGTGRVLELPDGFSPSNLKSMLTINGGEPLTDDLTAIGGKVIDASVFPSR